MTREERAERVRACKALEAMWAARPLSPPPGQISERTVPASRLALVQDRRAGIVHDPRPVRVRDKVAATCSWFDDADGRP